MKAKAFSSIFSGFSPPMPVRLSELSGSFNNAVITSVASSSSSSSCIVTYATSSPILSARPSISHAVSDKSSSKRKCDCPKSSFGVSDVRYVASVLVWIQMTNPPSPITSRLATL